MPGSGRAAKQHVLDLSDALRLAGWPSSLAAPEKTPRVVRSPAEFAEAALVDRHVDELIVLRGGVRALGLAETVPCELLRVAREQRSTRAFLAALDERLLRGLRARVYCTEVDGGFHSRDELELKKDASGAELDTLLDKWRELQRRGGVCSASASVYIGELRRAHKYRHPLDGRWVKTLLASDVKDWVGRARADAMPYWDRYDEGVFVGGRYSGSPLHVDQVSWSNVGKNFAGYKLLAIWPYGEASRALFDEHNYALFAPPLAACEEEALRAACKVALVGPGDAVLFSGGNAHMALSISAELSLTAYESFLNLNPMNLAAFLDSGTPKQYRQCRARAAMLEDIKLDVADVVEDLEADLTEGTLRDALIEAHAHAAIELLRADEFISRHVRTAPAGRGQPRPLKLDPQG